MFIAGLLELFVRSHLTGLHCPRRGWIHDWREISIALIMGTHERYALFTSVNVQFKYGRAE
jgi:hypothetical protein